MKLPPALDKAITRIDSLSRRDRLMVLGGLLAVLVAIDVQFVLAMRDRRISMLTSQAQTPAVDQAQVDAAAHAEREARLKEIRKQLEERRKNLALQGLASPPQAIFDELRKTLALPGVQVLALRALPDTEENEPALAAAASAPEEAAPADAPAEPASAPPPAIYRHRTEVRIAGPLSEVSRIVNSFEQPTLPLRLERVRFSAASDPSQVEASFVLLTISQDRTWLAL